MSGRYLTTQQELEQERVDAATRLAETVQEGQRSRALRTQRSQDSAASLVRSPSDNSVSSGIHRRNSREPLNATGRPSYQLEGHSPKPTRIARKMSRQASTNGFADSAQSALVANSVGPYRPANVESRLESMRHTSDMQQQPSLRIHAQRLTSLKSNTPLEFRPGSGEQGISNLSSWMTGAVPSTVASSTQSLDSPLASQDGNNLTGVFHQPSDAVVHTLPEPSSQLLRPLSMSTIYSENRQRSGATDLRSSAASEDPQASSTEPFLPPPEPSATSPTPMGSRRSTSTVADLQVVARFLRNSKISVEAIGGILGDSCPDSQELLNVFTGTFNFSGLEIDEALRSYLSQVWLHGETQKIERILEVFAQHYYTQNPSVYRCMEAARTMSFSLIMLNMNLHNPKVPKQDRMKLSDFFKQMRGTNEGEDFPEELLEALYNRVSMREFKLPVSASVEARVLEPPQVAASTNGLLSFLRPDKAGARPLTTIASMRASDAALTTRGTVRMEAIPSGRAIYADEPNAHVLTGDSAAIAEKHTNGFRDPGDALFKASRRSFCCCFKGS